jgi:predicted ArsR family transcriptional regulator
MNQLTLFDDAPQLARASDPVTSQAAAEDIRPKLSGLREAFVLALADLGGGPCTAREVAERARELGLHRETESVRKRASELEGLGLIQCQELQRCKHTGRPAEGWKLT